MTSTTKMEIIILCTLVWQSSAFVSVSNPAVFRQKNRITIVPQKKDKKLYENETLLSTSAPASTWRRKELFNLKGAIGRTRLNANDSSLCISPVNHRYSASDWLHNVRSLPQSQVLREILNPVVTMSVWSSAVSLTYNVLLQSPSPVLRRMASHMCIGSAPHSFLVSALGLLLVFRTNSAYQRFAEGRKIWESILSTSRNLTRMLTLYECDVTGERLDRARRLLAAFPYLLRHHIRPRCLSKNVSSRQEGEHMVRLRERPPFAVETRQDDGDSRIGSPSPSKTQPPSSTSHYHSDCWVDKRSLPWCLLPPSTLSSISNASNRPLWIMDRVAMEIAAIPASETFTSRERLTMLKHVERLTGALGACERIHQTAVPLNYARHSLRSLTLWLFTLPFALVKDLGFLTGPIVGAVSWLLLGVYQIGYSIEDPFQGSLRLSILCEGIRKDVLGEDHGQEGAFHLEDRGQNDGNRHQTWSDWDVEAVTREINESLRVSSDMKRNTHIVELEPSRTIQLLK